MKRAFVFCLVWLMTTPVLAKNYLLKGGQESVISYKMTRKIKPAPDTRKIVLSFVIPTSFRSSTYHQIVQDLNFDFSPPPSSRSEKIDHRGNKVIEVTWETPSTPITTTTRLRVINSLKLETLKTNAPFPLKELPGDVEEYLKSTEQVDVNNKQVRAKAHQLTDSSKTQFDAIQKILTWMVDHMSYVVLPFSYDATYSLQSGKGNCQNYSHLSAAMMRAVGIPVRIVNGITLKQPYDINTGNSILTMKMAQGRHSWIEIYFPDLGWVPFDPQSTELFVSNRFIRVEIGIDNHETHQDGLTRWVQVGKRSSQPYVEENIKAEFISDRIQLLAHKTNYGPRELLFSPQVEAAFSKVPSLPQPPLPQRVPEDELKKLQYLEPYIFGNLDFPENIDFLSVRGPVEQGKEGTMEMRKNFLVETAEYVTTQGNQYAQTFILTKPTLLKKIGLALHKFGPQGQLWLELLRDENGKPGKYIATSEILPVSQITYSPGYAWVDFDFSESPVLLSPGRYWVALGFTGSPIVNWFFTYGKPVGPADGTRYKTMFDETWSRSLSYEFNYRVIGLVTKQ